MIRNSKNSAELDTTEDHLLVSIHSHYAELILSGVKSVELRRRFARNVVGRKMFIYATLPKAAVVGHVQIEGIEHISVAEIWDLYGARAAISRDAFTRYFEGVNAGYAILLSEPKRYDHPVPLQALRAIHKLTVPQSYTFLREAHRELIEHEQDQGPHRH